MSNNWLDKYTPKKISDITSNIIACNEIKYWLSNFNKNKEEYFKGLENDKEKTTNNKKGIRKRKAKYVSVHKSTLLISGNNSIGKTSTVNVIIKELNYNIKTINMDTIKTNNDVISIFNKLLSHDITFDPFESVKKYVLLVDNLHLLKKKYLTIIKKLQKINEKKWYFPIILINTSQHNKLINDIQKSCKPILFKPLTNKDITSIIVRICKKEGMTFSGKPEKNKILILEKLIDMCQGDIKQLVLNLESLYMIYGKKQISLDDVNNFMSKNKIKDKDMNFFLSTSNLLYNYQGIDFANIIFESDSDLYPLTMNMHYQTALIKKYNTNKINGKQTLNAWIKISDLLSTGDVVNSCMYGDQNWSMQKLYGIYSCCLPSYYLNQYQLNKNRDYRMTSIPCKDITYNYPIDANKKSIRQINEKQIIIMDKYFNGNNIYDYINIINIVNHLIERKDYYMLRFLLYKYQIDVKALDTLIKIDKTSLSLIKTCTKSQSDNYKYIKVDESTELTKSKLDTYTTKILNKYLPKKVEFDDII